MMLSLIILSFAGFCIALYTYATEIRVAQDPTFRPACDISNHISCTKPMKSPYANIFFFSNAIVAILFYALMFAVAMLGSSTLALIGAIAGSAASCYLAYLLYFKVKSLCILCTSLYIINFLMLYFSIRGF